MPTQDQILVPETLLKKRKSQEKARAERNSNIEKRKKVSPLHLLHNLFDDDKYHYRRLDLLVDVVAFVNHLSGLSML